MVLAPPAAATRLRLPEKAAGAVLETLDAIAANPRPVGKPLQFALGGRWSIRRGPYRHVYRLDEDDQTDIVLAIGHRADGYRPR